MSQETRVLKKVAVLGSGVMGSRIACHFANIGLEVKLLDMADKESKNRNAIAQGHLTQAVKSNPSPLFSKSFVNRIQVGNFEDHKAWISDCDWVIEVIIERLDIKKQLFEWVEEYKKPHAIISSNTSGIPIHLMTEGRSEEFKKHFLGTHFFNPPRYLELLEIIPTQDTVPEVVDFLMEYGQKQLGKRTVLAKDTPAFIGNRIGVFSIASILQQTFKEGWTIEAIDFLTGPIVGRPKSATFRTADVVGLDTLALVADGLSKMLKDDPYRHYFELPEVIQWMIAEKKLGAKTGEGFFKKVKNEDGKSEILSLDFETKTYGPQQKVRYPELEAIRNHSNTLERIKQLYELPGKIGDFYRQTFTENFAYAALNIPTISDTLYSIDDAIEAGFGWEFGPFRIWEAIGFENVMKQMRALDLEIAPWLLAMEEKGLTAFYKIEGTSHLYYDVAAHDYKENLTRKGQFDFQYLKENHTVWSNAELSVLDLGDGILNIAFHSKMNTIGSEILEGINHAIDLAEASYKGIVVYNEGGNFSAGANVGLIFMMAMEQEIDELNYAVSYFQNTMMRLRYCAVPVVAAPHQMALGGGCELLLHSDHVVAHAESYIGLVEFGVGVIPGGGGSKEFAQRIGDQLTEGSIGLDVYRHYFMTVAQAKVSTSAEEAFELGYLIRGRDSFVMSRALQLKAAKELCLQRAHEGYRPPAKRKDIKVLGNQALGLAYVGADSMRSGHYISDHDQKISQELAFVLAGGDLSEPTMVSEDYLLKLEREAFLKLAMQRKTLERLQSLVTTGKILRN